MAFESCRYCGKSLISTILAIHEASCSDNPSRALVLPPPPPVVIDQVAITQPIIADMAPWNTGNGIEAPVSGPEIVVTNTFEGMFQPKRNPYFVMPLDMANAMDRFIKQSEDGLIVDVMLTGPQGCGKTTIGLQVAFKAQRWCYIAACVTMQEPGQWWGKDQVADGRTFYVESQFVKAVETPGCVVILDDLNRVENPKVLNPLFPLLDDRRETYLEDLRRTVKVAAGVIFIGTANEGFQFQGTDPIDLALNDRFEKIKVAYPPGNQIQEIIMREYQIPAATATIFGRFADALAHHQSDPYFISMRQMKAMARAVKYGANIRDAVNFTLAASLSDEETERVQMVLQSLLQDNFTAAVPDWRPWG